MEDIMKIDTWLMVMSGMVVSVDDRPRYGGSNWETDHPQTDHERKKHRKKRKNKKRISKASKKRNGR